jgi:hypothetical protein
MVIKHNKYVPLKYCNFLVFEAIKTLLAFRFERSQALLTVCINVPERLTVCDLFKSRKGHGTFRNVRGAGTVNDLKRSSCIWSTVRKVCKITFTSTLQKRKNPCKHKQSNLPTFRKQTLHTGRPIRIYSSIVSGLIVW